MNAGQQNEQGAHGRAAVDEATAQTQADMLHELFRMGQVA